MITHGKKNSPGPDAGLLVLVPVLNKKGINFCRAASIPCAVGPVWITDPLIGLQTILTTLTLDPALFLSMSAPVIPALALGRVFCGWICPQNTFRSWSIRPRRRGSGSRDRSPAHEPLFRVSSLAADPRADPACSAFPWQASFRAGIISVQTAGSSPRASVGPELGLIGLIVVSELFLVAQGMVQYILSGGRFLGIFRLHEEP